ncbi:hypothetical protein HMPREF1614_02747 [Escherichia coli 908624]|nr:hypothetical protein HMPREF1614_02747 [Escherichia coli 908624]
MSFLEFLSRGLQVRILQGEPFICSLLQITPSLCCRGFAK